MISRCQFPHVRAGLIFFTLSTLVANLSLHANESLSDEEQRWRHIKALQQELSGNPPKGINEIEYFAPVKAQLHKEATDFAADFSSDPKHWEAMLLELKTDVFPVPAADRKTIFQQHETLVSAILGAKDAPPELKQNAERTILFQHLDHLDLMDTPQAAADLDRRLVAYLQLHPDDPKAASMQVRRLDVLAKYDAAKVAPQLETLAASNDPKVAAAARGRLARGVFADAPLDWKFTAVDGSAIDFSQMRGHVILVDYWASWCPDCLRALPSVLAAYHKYHEKGLEIVGVSLDSDQDALTGFLKKHEMPWPQQYDGKGWETDAVLKYGVRGIPEMWLVGKDGRLSATGVEAGELDAKLAALLGGQSPD